MKPVYRVVRGAFAVIGAVVTTWGAYVWVHTMIERRRG